MNQENKQEITFEEFRLLRREGFLRGICFLVLVVVMIILMIIMSTGNVADSDRYKFRTFAFIIGLVYLGYLSVVSRKVFPVQKAHPEWLKDTSPSNNKVKLPKEWNRKRALVTIVSLFAILLAFFIFYQPGAPLTNVEPYDATKEEIKNSYQNEQVQNALDNAKDSNSTE